MATKKDNPTVSTETTTTATTTTTTKAVESKYTIDEFVSNSKIFGTHKIIVKTALKLGGKTEYTKNEAMKIVNEFKNKGVKR